MIELAYWVLVVLVALPTAAWIGGAIYYDVADAKWWGRVLALVWLACVIAAFVFWRPAWQPLVGFAASVGGFLAWWSSLAPSQDRDWRPELSRPPSATIRGDEIVLHDVRHATYQSLDDVTPRYDERCVRLSKLKSMHLLISWWGSKFMCHPFAIFEFAPERAGAGPVRVAFSLEVRARKGQSFSLYRNLYKQNELICVMADERDLMRRRVDHEPDRRLFLYRLKLTPETIRTRFGEYLDLINALAAKPAWYHALMTNCTTAIFRRYRSRRPPLDWRVLVNGQMDEWLYDLGVLETGGLEFDELRERSFINDRVRAATDEAVGERFGHVVREGLPGFGFR